jgi:hypothetical protein
MKSIKAKALNDRPTSVVKSSVAKLYAVNVPSSERKSEDKNEGSKPMDLQTLLVSISNELDFVLAGK